MRNIGRLNPRACRNSVRHKFQKLETYILFLLIFKRKMISLHLKKYRKTKNKPEINQNEYTSISGCVHIYRYAVENRRTIERLIEWGFFFSNSIILKIFQTLLSRHRKIYGIILTRRFVLFGAPRDIVLCKGNGLVSAFVYYYTFVVFIIL